VFESLPLDVAVPFRRVHSLLRHDRKSPTDLIGGPAVVFRKEHAQSKKLQAQSWFHRERSRIRRDPKNENWSIGKFMLSRNSRGRIL
jgi:hypothetical protein